MAYSKSWKVGNYDEFSKTVRKDKSPVFSASFAENTGCIPCAGNVWVAKNSVDLARVGKVKCVVAFRTHISALNQAVAQQNIAQAAMKLVVIRQPIKQKNWQKTHLPE